MLNKKKLWVIFFSIISASCSSVSPDYTTPKTDMPTEWANFSSKKLTIENNFAYTAWWERFHDQTLNQLMTEGLKNNNSIGEAQGNLEQAKGALKAVKLSWIPSLPFVGGYSTNPALGGPFGFYGIWPQYSAFNIFNTISMTKSAKLQVAVQEKSIAATKLILVGQIANSYYTYIAQVKQLKLYEQYQQDLNEILAIQQADYQDGISSDIEVEAIMQKVHQAKIQQKTIQNNIIMSQNALRYLLNQNPGKTLTKTKFSQVNTNYSNSASLPVSVLADRPDVAIAKLQYHLAVQDTGGVQTGLLPSVQLDTFQGAVNVGSPQFFGERGSFYDAYLAWTLNPMIFGQIDAQKGIEKTAYYHYIDTVKKAWRDVDNDLVTHDIANQNYIASHQAYKNAQQKYLLTLRLYQTSIVPYLAVLQEKINVDQAAIDDNQMKLMQMVTLVNLYQDLGGGSAV